MPAEALTSFTVSDVSIILLVCGAYWTIHRQTNSRSVKSRTGQLADSKMFKMMKRLHYICTLNLNLNSTLTHTNHWKCSTE